MRKVIRAPIVLLFLALISSAAIMCSTGRGFEPAAKTVELRQVQRVNTALTAAINSAIWGSVAGQTDIDENTICPPHMSIKMLLDQRFWRYHETDVKPEKLSVNQLEELRTLVNLRADEAFKAGANTAGYRDLLSVQVGTDAITGKIAAPSASVEIR